jgi:hypothetical protein
MQHPGWLLILGGLLIVIIGIVWLLTPSFIWLGKLPGDIVIERGNSRFNIPIVTCILISLVLTMVLWLIRLFSR